jgi:hypothetical protein
MACRFLFIWVSCAPHRRALFTANSFEEGTDEKKPTPYRVFGSPHPALRATLSHPMGEGVSSGRGGEDFLNHAQENVIETIGCKPTERPEVNRTTN